MPATKKRTKKRTPAPLRTLDEAASLLLQLEPAHVDELRELARGLRELAAETGHAEVRRHASAAAEAVETAVELTGDEAAEGLVIAGHAIEAAMAAGEVEAAMAAGADAAAVTGSADGADDIAAPATGTAAIDPMAWALEALAEFDAADAAAAAAAGSSAAADVVPGAGAAQGAVANESDALPADADMELLEAFAAESQDYLQGAEAALLSIEANPGDVESVNTVFRCFHTIKGTAAFMGLSRVSELAHRAESLLSRVRDGDIALTGHYADLALRSRDVLGEMVSAVQAALQGAPLRVPASYAGLMAALENPDAGAGQGGVMRSAAVATVAAAPAVADVPAAAGVGGVEGGAQEPWMRVRTDRLDRLVDTIGELVIAQSMIAQDGVVMGGAHELLTRNVTHAGKIVRELQDLSISMRMVPVRPQFQKLARLVRDLAQRSGKQVTFVTSGEDTEVDRNMVDIIGDPLVHMVRNSIDHGLETPKEREFLGKPAAGTIRVAAFHAGGSVVVQLSDDGRGLNRERILEKARARGLVEADRNLSDREIDALIFAPGFSTAEQVTEISGRGVGMDVVRRNVESLRGRVEIESVPGEGITFTIRLPLTLALTDGMLVRAGRERYIVPTNNIQLSFRPAPGAVTTYAGRGEMVMLRDELLPVVRLHRLFTVQDAETDPEHGLLVVIGTGAERCALLVDELLGQHQVVTKSLGAGIGKVHGIAGGAILGDGRVGLIIEPAEISALARGREDALLGATA